MRSSQNKILIIVLIVIAVLALSGGVFAYTFFATDVFRTGQQLFAKYLTQDLEELSQNMNIEKMEKLNEKLEQNKHEESTSISYTQVDEVNPTVQLTIDSQNDPTNKKNYGILGLSMEGLENQLKVEYMIDNDAYSLRFSNVIKQFLTIENSNLRELAIKLGMDEEIANEIPDSIDFEKLSLEKVKLTEDEKNAVISKYAKLIYNNISKEKYTKTKNTIITLNGKTITTNAYALTLNTRDLNNLAIKLLEAIKEDEIILAKLQMLDEMVQEYAEESLKDTFMETIQTSIEQLKEAKIENETNIVITIYEQNGKTVRIKLEQELDSITLDTFEVEGKKQAEINYTSISSEDNTQSSIKVVVLKESDNKLNIKLTSIDGEEQQISENSIELIETENNMKLNVKSSNEYGNITIVRDINFVEEIDYKVDLNNSNNLILNELSNERINYIFEALEPQLEKVYSKPLEESIVMLAMKIYYEGLESIGDVDFTEAEIAAFNGKFEQYEGSNVLTTKVNSLLNTVFAHNQQEAADLLVENNQQNRLQQPRYVTVSGDVTLKPTATSVTKLSGASYYTVKCYKDAAGLVTKIEVTKNDSDVSLDQMSYTPSGAESITKTYAVTDWETTIQNEKDLTSIENTGEKVTSILKTIGTIVVVIMLLF